MAETATITATFRNTSGQPLAGAVAFTPETTGPILDAEGDVVLMPTPVVFLIENGVMDTATLIATDDPDLNPTGWTYKVSIRVSGHDRETFSIEVPAGTTSDLADLAPVATSTGHIRTVPGPKGDKGDKGDTGPMGTLLDTGWRDVSGELEAGWDGPLLVRRVGQFVCFGSTDSPLFGPGGGGVVVWIPPQGWRPVGLSALPSYFGTGAVTARPTQIDVAGGIAWGPGGSYITDDPEPDPQDWPGVPWEA